MTTVFCKNIGTKIRTGGGYLFVIGVCVLCLIGRVYGNSLFASIRTQNTGFIDRLAEHRAQDSIAKTTYTGITRPYCVTPEDVTIRIYMYHYVRPAHRDPAYSGIWNNSITPGMFDTHMTYLHDLQNTRSVSIGFLSELEEWQKSGCYPHNNIIILTADDGRWDTYGYLFPTAVKYGIKFNLGIIYEKTQPTHERINPFSSTEEVQHMARHPLMEIQSHSMTHADLRTLSYTEQAKEICFSKQGLERLLDIEINTFIAPYGGMTEYLAYIASTCGYSYALSTKSGYVQPSELLTRPYDLERIRVTRNISAQDLFGE